MTCRLFFLLVLSITATRAVAMSISMAPRPAFLLRSGDFVAQDSLTSFAHYDSAGKVIARFASFDARFAAITPDESRIVLSNYNGKVAVADMKTGQIIWSKSATDATAMNGAAPSLSQDGSACVTCGGNEQITVLDVRTGKLLGGVHLSSPKDWIESAALTPDGATGVLLRDDKHVYTFDVKTGAMTDTEILGNGPLTYSADGRYFAILSGRSKPQLRIVDTATLKWNDIGDFYDISEIRALADGTFRVTADIEAARDHNATAAFVCSPSTLKIESIWQSSAEDHEYRKMDFNPETMASITTDFRLVTRILDLRDSKILLTVDNSASYAAAFDASRARRRAENTRFLISFFLIAGICVSAITVLIMRMLKSRTAAKNMFRQRNM